MSGPSFRVAGYKGGFALAKKESEVERIMRIRQQQLEGRDPHAKQRETDRRVAARRRKMRKQVSYLDIITDVPRKWQGIVLGLMFGVVIWIGLFLLVEASWVDMAGVAAMVVLAIVGFFFGQALDVRDELRDLAND
jgi:hypothetical protein